MPILWHTYIHTYIHTGRCKCANVSQYSYPNTPDIHKHICRQVYTYIHTSVHSRHLDNLNLAYLHKIYINRWIDKRLFQNSIFLVSVIFLVWYGMIWSGMVVELPLFVFQKYWMGKTEINSDYVIARHTAHAHTHTHTLNIGLLWKAPGTRHQAHIRDQTSGPIVRISDKHIYFKLIIVAF